MKKILFNDRYGLTRQVLSGCKTQTRRVIPDIEIDWVRRGKVHLPVGGYEHGVLFMDVRSILHDAGIRDYAAPAKYQPKYEIGEEIAVAQKYKELIGQGYLCRESDGWVSEEYVTSPGYSNKMFVRADFMPHRIRITNIRVERLQDISEEDAMREGIFKYDKPPLHHEMDLYSPWPPYVKPYKHNNENLKYSCSARYAFAYLIDKVSGTGTWQRNPWVFVYEFELVK